MILSMVKQNPSESTSNLSIRLGTKVDHSAESIRDRIKRYINKLSKRDEKVIIEANQWIPDHFIYFVKDKSHNKKHVSHISQEPPLITGWSLSLRDRKNVAKLHRRKVKEERDRKREYIREMSQQGGNTPGKNSGFLSTNSPFKTLGTEGDTFTPTKLHLMSLKENWTPKMDEKVKIKPEDLEKIAEYKGRLRQKGTADYQK